MTNTKLTKVLGSEWWVEQVGELKRPAFLSGANGINLSIPVYGKGQNCSWSLQNGIIYSYLWFVNTPLTPTPTYREIDYYHAMAHILAPSDKAMHGVEFVKALIEVTTQFKFDGLTKADSKKMLKDTLLKHRIKTFTRTPREKKPEDMIKEIRAMQEKLLAGLGDD